MLGFLLHVTLGELLGVGSIFPFSLPIAVFDNGDSSLLDAYAWQVVNLSLILPYLCRRDLVGKAALWFAGVNPGLVMALAIGTFMVNYLGGTAIAGFIGTSNWTPDDDIRQDFEDQSGDPLAYALYAMVPTFVAPVVEELVFRGLLHTHVRAKLGPVPAILITGALFGLLHGGPLPYAASIVLAGILYGILREKTGGVTVSIAAHMLNNVIATLAML